MTGWKLIQTPAPKFIAKKNEDGTVTIEIISQEEEINEQTDTEIRRSEE